MAQAPVKANKSETSVTFVKTIYGDTLGTEVKKMLRSHNTTCNAIRDKCVMEGIHQEVVQSLRELQHVFNFEMSQLCRRCFEDFIIDTCDQVLVPYKYGENGTGVPLKLTRDEILSTPSTNAQDCSSTLGACAIS